MPPALSSLLPGFGRGFSTNTVLIMLVVTMVISDTLPQLCLWRSEPKQYIMQSVRKQTMMQNVAQVLSLGQKSEWFGRENRLYHQYTLMWQRTSLLCKMLCKKQWKGLRSTEASLLVFHVKTLICNRTNPTKMMPILILKRIQTLLSKQHSLDVRFSLTYCATVSEQKQKISYSQQLRVKSQELRVQSQESRVKS